MVRPPLMCINKKCVKGPVRLLHADVGCIFHIAWTWRTVFKLSFVEDAARKRVVASEPAHVVDLGDTLNDVMGVAHELPNAFAGGFFGRLDNEHPSVVELNERKFKQD